MTTVVETQTETRLNVVLNRPIGDRSIATPRDHSWKGRPTATCKPAWPPLRVGRRLAVAGFDRVAEVTGVEVVGPYTSELRVRAWCRVNMPILENGQVQDFWVWRRWQETWTWKPDPTETQYTGEPHGCFIVAEDSRDEFFRRRLPLVNEPVRFVLITGESCPNLKPTAELDVPDEHRSKLSRLMNFHTERDLPPPTSKRIAQELGVDEATAERLQVRLGLKRDPSRPMPYNHGDEPTAWSNCGAPTDDELSDDVWAKLLPCTLNCSISAPAIVMPRDWSRPKTDPRCKELRTDDFDLRDLYVGLRVEIEPPYRRGEVIKLTGAGRSVIATVRVHVEANSPVLCKDDAGGTWLEDRWCNQQWLERWGWSPDSPKRTIGQIGGFVTVLDDDREGAFKRVVPLIGERVTVAGYVGAEADWARIYHEGGSK